MFDTIKDDKQEIVNKPIGQDANDERNIYAFKSWADEMNLTNMISDLSDEMLQKCYLRWLESDGVFFYEE